MKFDGQLLDATRDARLVAQPLRCLEYVVMRSLQGVNRCEGDVDRAAQNR